MKNLSASMALRNLAKAREEKDNFMFLQINLEAIDE